MTDRVGYRAKIGVVIASTNTVVEHDLNLVGPPGVTFHSARFLVDSPDLSTDEAFLRCGELIRHTIPLAVRDVMTCEPDYLIMGMSGEAIWNTEGGSTGLVSEVREKAGDVGISSGASAHNAALARLGVHRIACLTSYPPVGDAQVADYFTECGFDVKRVHGLECETATSSSDVTPDTLVEALQTLDGDDIDAIVQCGTNLSMVEVADQAERWLGKPVLAVNAVCLWHALRALGIDDRFTGFGTMLREF